MHRLPFATPPRWWNSSLSPTLVRLLRPWRLKRMRKLQRIAELEVRGLPPVQAALADGRGLLITPNHGGDGDVDALSAAADRVGRPFHFMAAWQVFVEQSRIGQWVLQKHGVFSVNREGTDTRAIRHAVEILQTRPEPLVIFPEGEMYHLNDRVLPFLQGPAAIALMAGRKSPRPVAIIPTAVKFFYLGDPTPALVELMNEIEQKIFWRPRPNLTLPERIYRFATGAIALKELEYLGHTKTGPLPQRVAELGDAILRRIEERYGIKPDGALPDRIKKARQRAIEGWEKEDQPAPEREQCREDIDDLFLVCQLLSYPADYVSEEPSLERIAETLTKFESDALGRFRPPVRADRKAVVAFGEPLPIGGDKKQSAADVTRELEHRVQALIDELRRERTPAANREAPANPAT